MAKQRILPFFIPMEGCPHKCVYCDQVAISGHTTSPRQEEIMAALAAFPADPQAEVAFYGGSFTCLPRSRQEYYLQAAAAALAERRVGGIRISTRPDAIDAEVCTFLQRWGVTTVELGIQSFSAEVLAKAERGYTPLVAEEACRAVKEAGLRLGVQLMTGLPGDNPQLDRQAVIHGAQLGAELLRIYPTLVLEHTALAKAYQRGEYQPQSLVEAVACCRDMLIDARACGLTVIRVGLNPSAEVEASLLAGPYHPAFGGLVREAMKLAQIEQLLENYDQQTAAVLNFPPAELPLIWGNQRANFNYLAMHYPQLLLQSDAVLPPGALRLVQGNNTVFSLEIDFCRSCSLLRQPLKPCPR